MSEAWGQISKETWPGCEPDVQGVNWGTCQIAGATSNEGALVPGVSLWHWENECQSVLWMVTLGSFHNTTQATLRFADEFADTQAAQNL